MPSEWMPIRRKEMENFESHREFRAARELLRSEMVVQTRSGPKHLKITQVEPFVSLDQPSHKVAFDARSRRKGELFVIWHRGNTPFLNVVVDPAKGTIVCIKRALLDGKEVSATKIIQELGLDRGDFAEGPKGARTFRNRVNTALDGKSTESDDESPVAIETPRRTGGEVLEIRRGVAERARNSLGLFGNIGVMPK